MADRETIQLILDMASSAKDVKDVVDGLRQLQQASQDVAGSYQVLDRRAGSYAISTAQVDAETERAVAAAVERTSAERALARALEQGEAAQARAGGSLKAMNSRILELGRATQDFAQGGFAGIVNNLERIVGGAGPAAAAVTVLGTAFLVAKPYIDEWYKGLASNKRAIPESTDQIERLTESIKKQKEALEELKKQRELDYWDMQKYQQGVQKLAKEERELAQAREARSVGAGQSKANRERGSAFREALGEYGGSERLIEVLQMAGRTQKEAEEMIVDALRGVRGAADRIQAATAGAAANSQFGWVSPETARRRQLQGQQTDAILRNRAQKIREEEREKERLNREGLANEKAMDRQREAAGKADARADAAGRARSARNALDMSRRLGRAGDREAREQVDTKHLPLMHVPGPNATRMQLQQAMIQNQQAMTQTQAQLQQQLQEARDVLANQRRMTRQRRQAMNNAGWN